MRTAILCGLVAAGIAGATVTADAAPARVRIINDYLTIATPAPGSLDVRLGTDADAASNPVLATVSYGAITKYRKVKPGTYTVGVFAAGRTATRLLERPLPLTKNQRVTIWARQTSAADPSVTLDVLGDTDRRPKRTNASVRIVHGIPAPAANDVRLGVAGAGCLTPAMSFPAQAVIELPKGRFTLGLYPAADATCAGSPLPGLSAEVKLRAKQRYTAIARVAEGDPSAFQLHVVRDF
jgi:hypothetical protein